MSDPDGTGIVIDALHAARHERRPCVLVTIAAFKGSTPRKPGAKMLVFEDSPPIGTVGGGALEFAMVKEGLSVISAQETKLIERHLARDLGMCCGGGVTVLLEPQIYSPRLMIFGAGHIAKPLAYIASMTGFDVTIIDSRPELANKDRFPTVDAILLDEPVDTIGDLALEGDNSYVVVVTHSHKLDEKIAGEALKQSTRYIGVIGSRRKGETLRKNLAASGLSAEQIAQMRTPVGLDIKAETPEEIAVSIISELIAVRRG